MKYYLYTESKENDGYEPNLIAFDTLKEIEEQLTEYVQESCFEGYDFTIIKGEPLQFSYGLNIITE